jgi:hypothetical protein
MTLVRRISVSLAAVSLLTAGCSSSAASPVATASAANVRVVPDDVTDAGDLGGQDAPTPTATPTPTVAAQAKTVEAVTAAAQEAFDRYVAGDFAGTWQMYTAAGRAAVTQADYVRLSTACPGLQHTKVTIAKVRIEGDKATVRIELGQMADSYILDYQGGQWLIEPSAFALAEYKQGIDKAIAARKAAKALLLPRTSSVQVRRRAGIRGGCRRGDHVCGC